MNNEFKLEKDVPVPPAKVHNTQFPLQMMEVGDSFVMPLVDRNRLTAATTYLRIKGVTRKFTTRRISDTEMRVWRIEDETTNQIKGLGST